MVGRSSSEFDSKGSSKGVVCMADGCTVGRDRGSGTAPVELINGKPFILRSKGDPGEPQHSPQASSCRIIVIPPIRISPYIAGPIWTKIGYRRREPSCKTFLGGRWRTPVLGCIIWF